MFSAFPLTFFGGVMAAREGYFKKLIKPLIVLFSIMCVWAVLQFFLLNGYYNGQARHPLADPSSLGALFSLVLFCALGWVLADRPKKEHRLAVAFAILVVCGIMSTVARGPVFAFAPGFLLFAVLLWPQIKAKRKSLFIILLGALAFYGVMQTGIQKRYDLGKRLYGTVSLEMENPTNNRLYIWESTLHMIKDKPLLGTGMGTYFLLYPEYRLKEEADGVFLAHNDPLQFWVELGVLGPILFYAFAVACAARSFKALKQLGPEKIRERLIIVSIFAALTALVAQSHVSFNHYNLSILMLEGLLLSLWFHATGQALKEPQSLSGLPETMPAAVNKIILALPLVLMGWLFSSVMAGEYYASRARDNLFAGQMDCGELTGRKTTSNCFMDNINNAAKISMGLNYRAYLFAVNVPIAILEDRKDLLSEEQQKKLYEQVVGYMYDALAINPRVATAYYYLAKVQTLVRPEVIPKDTASAEELYRRALTIDPVHLGARMALLALYKQQNVAKEAQLALLEEGITYSYNTTMAMDYYSELSRLYLETGNYGKMKEIMNMAIRFKKRSDYSAAKQANTLPQAIMGGNEMFQVP
ncbi:MAG: hypothetical protein DI551_11030 [Micavibrio aeruginosavorus]|uniref:O-antigen ligase-related domain-containing protein n=1 Tax=Micavibrio aeruginosavorus TaxID=349221 RepID=A0A2W5MUW7_9BACT|nr:MAG: hypothetical protein DI551_11030 [Micavibrio aeruginosavorus]